MSEPITIPTDEQVQQLVAYLFAQARFHQYQFNKASTTADAAAFLHQASFCEGWAMGIPQIVTELRLARSK